MDIYSVEKEIKSLVENGLLQAERRAKDYTHFLYYINPTVGSSK